MTQTVEKSKYEFIGIDVAKDKFDVCLSNNKKYFAFILVILQNAGFYVIITLLNHTRLSVGAN